MGGRGPGAAEAAGGLPLDAREFVAPFPAARRKDSPPAFGFHPCAEAVGHVAAAHFGLKRTFRQRILSSLGFGAATLRAAPADVSETYSVNVASGRVKEGVRAVVIQVPNLGPQIPVKSP